MTQASPEPKPSRLVAVVPVAALLVFALYLAFLVFRPFFLEFTVAASVALLLAPLHQKLTRRLKGRSALSASVLVLTVVLVILVPILSLAALLESQAGAFFDWIRPHLQPEELQKLWNETLPSRFPALLPWFKLGEERLTPLVSGALSRFAEGLNALIQGAVGGLTSALLDLVLFLMMLFFLLKDGAALGTELRHISPLSAEQEDQIFDHLSRTVKGVLQAMALVPLAQGVLGVLGFWLFGVPSAVLWGVMVILASLVPILGSPLAWVPACVYLFATGSTWPGVGMLLYGVFVISSIDNFVKPWLLKEAANIHPVLGFLSIFGGILAFGATGFLVGPVVLSLVLSAVRIYRLDILPTQRKRA